METFTMIIKLSRNYKAIYGVPFIERVDSIIFHAKYISHCFSCDYCNDWCCQHGVDIDIENMSRIMEMAETIEEYVGINRAEWFTRTMTDDLEFPGEKHGRTAIRGRGCVFLDPAERGCLLHRYAIEHEMDYHVIKPMISSLFPLTFDQGLLHGMTEVEDGTIICKSDFGETLYRGVRNELHYYWGDEFVDELDKIEQDISGNVTIA